jgi:hypothetical protein
MNSPRNVTQVQTSDEQEDKESDAMSVATTITNDNTTEDTPQPRTDIPLPKHRGIFGEVTPGPPEPDIYYVHRNHTKFPEGYANDCVISSFRSVISRIEQEIAEMQVQSAYTPGPCYIALERLNNLLDQMKAIMLNDCPHENTVDDYIDYNIDAGMYINYCSDCFTTF